MYCSSRVEFRLIQLDVSSIFREAQFQLDQSITWETRLTVPAVVLAHVGDWGQAGKLLKVSERAQQMCTADAADKVSLRPQVRDRGHCRVQGPRRRAGRRTAVREGLRRITGRQDLPIGQFRFIRSP